MQTGGMLLAEIVWLFYLVDFCNLMTAGAKCNFNYRIETIGIMLANIT